MVSLVEEPLRRRGNRVGSNDERCQYTRGLGFYMLVKLCIRSSRSRWQEIQGGNDAVPLLLSCENRFRQTLDRL
jgi:hypothetical protein